MAGIRAGAVALAALLMAAGCGSGDDAAGVYDLTFDLVPADLPGRLVVPGGDAGGGVLMLLTRPPRQLGAREVRLAHDTLVAEFTSGAELRLVLVGDSLHGFYRPTDIDTTFVRGARSAEPVDPAVATALRLQPEAPGVLSVPAQGDGFPTLGGGRLVLTRSTLDWRRHVLVSTTPDGDGWAATTALPFSGGAWNDRSAAFAPGDSLLVFASDRPLPGDSAGGRWNLWRVALRDGAWGEPAPLALNSDSADFHPSVAGDGTLYFSSRREGGQGGADIWRAPWRDGAWGEPVNLGPTVNSAASEGGVLVDPAQRWLLVAVTDRAGSLGSDDLWLSEGGPDGWGPLRNPGAPLNSFEADYGAALDPDGTHLWFSSHRRGFADLYRIPLAELGLGS